MLALSENWLSVVLYFAGKYPLFLVALSENRLYVGSIGSCFSIS